MISVIIPTFNRGILIAQTIDSILRQSHCDLELIVVDDHSEDNTGDIVTKFSSSDVRVTYLKRPTHFPKGANSCRNYGFEIAKGKYIKWIDSDDLLTPNALEIQLASLESSEADLSICNSEVFTTDPSHPSEKWGNIDTEVSVSNFLQAKFRWHTGAGLWRKSYFEDTPPWKEGLMNSQEWLMHLNQLVKGVRLVRVPQTLCLVRSHTGSMSHKSNKSGTYYYNECKARSNAFELISKSKVSLTALAKKKLNNQFLWYHLFILYKLDFFSFLRVFRFYLHFLKFQLVHQS